MKVADFGQSRLRDSQDGCWGTLEYMAPEQAVRDSGLPAVAWDVFGFGATAYWLLTRRRAYLDDKTLNSLADTADLTARLTFYRQSVLTGALVPIRELNAAVDEPLANIIEACLQPDAENRPDSFSEILVDFENRAASLPLLCRRPWTLGYRMKRAAERILQLYVAQPALLASSLALVLTFVAIVMLTVGFNQLKAGRQELAAFAAATVSDVMAVNMMLDSPVDKSDLDGTIARLPFLNHLQIRDRADEIYLEWNRDGAESARDFRVTLPIIYDDREDKIYRAGPTGELVKDTPDSLSEEKLGSIIVSGDYDGYWETDGRQIMIYLAGAWFVLFFFPWLYARRRNFPGELESSP